MKRRSFLGLLGLAPAAPLIAKELATEGLSAPIAPDIYPMTPINEGVQYAEGDDCPLSWSACAHDFYVSAFSGPVLVKGWKR